MRIAQEEIFGPVASAMPFDTVDEVVERSNRTEFGLGGGVWTRDVGKAHRLAQEIRTGVVWVNTYNRLDPATPFGGCKSSGWGNELSLHSLAAMCGALGGLRPRGHGDARFRMVLTMG
jgi:aldehyde dehydrogenase (NAD+)